VQKAKKKKYFIKGNASDKQIEQFVDVIIEEAAAKKQHEKQPVRRKKAVEKRLQ
jgi:hypothetical protein